MKENKHIAIVVSRWNELITKSLLEGAKSEIAEEENIEVTIYQVPGAWEVPVTIKTLFSSTEKKPDAVVALGCILVGETQHGRILSADVSSALMRLQTDYGIPISWGILTPDTPEQALDRAGLKKGNKGREAASAALAMLKVLQDIR